MIGQTINDISNRDTIVISFKDNEGVPIEAIESLTFELITAETEAVTVHTITPSDATNVRFYHYETHQGIPANFRIQDGKVVNGRSYATNENVIKQVDSIKLKSITYNGTTSIYINTTKSN